MKIPFFPHFSLISPSHHSLISPSHHSLVSPSHHSLISPSHFLSATRWECQKQLRWRLFLATPPTSQSGVGVSSTPPPNQAGERLSSRGGQCFSWDTLDRCRALQQHFSLHHNLYCINSILGLYRRSGNILY